MRKFALIILTCYCYWILTSFRSSDFKRFYFTGFAQGTSYHITYYAADSVIVQRQIDSLLKTIDESLSLYLPGSLVNTWNNSKKGVAVDAHFRTVVKKAQAVFNDTEGIFDITVFPLTNAWGFGPVKPAGRPDSATIQAILPCVNSNLLFWRGKKLKKKKPCIQIDPNGIAQGYSVDLLAELLEKNGVINYLVELGGEIRVKGKKYPSEEYMIIGIEAPNDDPFEPIMQQLIQVKSGAITTSGNYRRYEESNGTRISHLLDPRSGYTLKNEMISVTLIAPDAITADAYDNAIMGMGLREGLKFVEAHPHLAAHIVYADSSGIVRDTISSRFKSYLLQQ